MLTLVYLIIAMQDVPAISGHRCVADFSQSEGTVMLDGHLFPSIFLMEREGGGREEREKEKRPYIQCNYHIHVKGIYQEEKH